MIDPNAKHLKVFEDFEYSGWQKTAASYSRFSLLTQQSVVPLLENLKLTPKDYLLDVACGPGFLANQASEKGCKATGIDFSKNMIKIASINYPQVSFKVASAEETGFPGNTFTKIAINHGLIHFARPQLVLTELNRIAKSKALLGLTLWDSPDRSIAYSLVTKVATKYATSNDLPPKAIPMDFYTNIKNINSLFKKTGWIFEKIIHLPIVWHLDNAESLIDILKEGTVRQGSILKKLTEAEIKKIKKEIAVELMPYTDKNKKVKVPQGVLLIIAKKI